MEISQGKNEKNLTDLSSCKYNLKYVRLDSGIHSFRRPPKYPCHMKLVGYWLLLCGPTNSCTDSHHFIL